MRIQNRRLPGPDAEEAELNAKSSLFERLRQLSEGIEELSKLQKAADTARNALPGSRKPLTMPRWNSPGFRRNTTPGKAARLAKKLEKARSARCAALRSTRSRRRGRMRYHLSSSSIRLRRTLQKRQGRNPMRSVTSPKREGSLTAHRANVSRDYLSLMGVEFPENGAAESSK